MEKPDDFLGQILNRGPSRGTLFLVLKKINQEGRHSEVIQGCLRALGKYPDDINLRILLAESCFEIGSVGQAEEELRKALLMIEALISSYKLKAKIYMRQQRSEEAVDALKLFLAHNPQDQEALDLLEQVTSAQTDTVEEPEEPPEGKTFPEAQDQEVINPLALDPYSGQDPLDTGTLDLVEQDRPAQTDTIKEAEESPWLEPSPEEKGDQEVLDLLEQVGQPKGDTDQAHHESTKDGETISSEIATSTLAEIYYNQGQINEAVSTYKKVLLNNPDDKESRARLSELNALIKKREDPRAENIDSIKLQKEKMIKILEKWQTNLQMANHGK